MLYLARDKSGLLGCYSAKPTKGQTKWLVEDIKNFVGFVYSDKFDKVKWEDEEPKELDLKVVAMEQVANSELRELEINIEHWKSTNKNDRKETTKTH